MAKDYGELASRIIELCGGKKNIKKVTHCFTRLRMELADNTAVNVEGLKELPDVIGVNPADEQFQVILGPKVNDVFDFVTDQLGLEDIDNQEQAETDNKQKVNPFNKVLDIISQCFAPIIPAIVGAGLMKGILALLTTIGVLNDGSGTYTVIYAISDAAFYFIPFLLAVSASRKFGLNEFIGLSLAGVMLYPSIAGAEETIKFIGISIPQIDYASTIVPIILGIWFTSVIYKLLNKYIPNVIKMIVVPVLTLMIAVPVTLIVLGPLGNYVGGLLSGIFETLFTRFPLVAGLVVGFIYPFIIMTGAHLAYFPVMISSIATIGYDTGFLQVGLFSNLATAGAVLAVAWKSKDANMKSVGLSSSVAAALGTTEPALYGVEMKLKKPLYATMITGALVSGIALLLGVKSFGLVSPGLLALPVYIDPANSANIIIAVAGSIAAFVMSFVLTVVFGKFDEE